MNPQRLKQLQTMPYEEYLKTPEWRKKRDQALERDGHRCRFCNRYDHLEVHHRTYARRGNEDLNDLTTVCDVCHEKHHERLPQSEMIESTRTDPRSLEEKKAATRRSWEEYLLGLLMDNTHLLSYVCGIITDDDFLNTDTRALYHLISNGHQKGILGEQTFPVSLQEVVDRSLAVVRVPGAQRDEKSIVKEAIQTATRVKRNVLLQKNEDLQHCMRDIPSNDKDVMRQLQQQLRAVHRQLRTINSATQLQG